MRVFMIDDEIAVIKSVQRSLFLYDIEVDYALNGKDAIAPVEAGNYDFVLLDYCMPDYPGDWFMRNVDLPANTEVILLTGYADKNIFEYMTDLGVVDCWFKPMTAPHIVEELNRRSACAAQ